MLKRQGSSSKLSDSQDKALQVALRFLGYQSRSEAEVRRRLVREGYTGHIIQNTLERLRSLHYINDETFARNWALRSAQRRGHGPKRMEQELRGKGISEPLIREVIRAAFAETDQTENAKRLLEKKYEGKNLSDPKILRRAAACLQRHGYDSKIISDLLGHPLEED